LVEYESQDDPEAWLQVTQKLDSILDEGSDDDGPPGLEVYNAQRKDGQQSEDEHESDDEVDGTSRTRSWILNSCIDGPEPRHEDAYSSDGYNHCIYDAYYAGMSQTETCLPSSGSTGDPEAMLVGRAARSEINLRDLQPREKALFAEAMAKEWKSWMDFNAVDVLTPEEVAKLPPGTKVIGTRWVHTDKNAKLRTSSTTHIPMAAKSRLVVQGCQEDDSEIRSDSPTASLLAFNLICAVAVLKKWAITAADASTAYLQSSGINRLLLLRAPRPPPPGLEPGQLMRAKGSIYGTKDAGRSWWLLLRSTLISLGWVESKFEAAFFLLWDAADNLVGLLLSHVDDTFSGGEGAYYEEQMQKLAVKIKLTFKKGTFRFCGKNVVQLEDLSIEVSQQESVENLEYMEIDKLRRKTPEAALIPEEITAFRSLIGAFGWIVRQTRHDLAVDVSMAAQSMGAPKIKHVVELNKAVKMAKETADVKLRFIVSDKMTYENAVIVNTMDSSFGNVDDKDLGEKVKSQCGYIMLLGSPDIENFHADGHVMLIEGSSGSIKRVCRSTLAAEANGFLAGAEAAEYFRTLMLELDNRHLDISMMDVISQGRTTLLFTDAKSLEATLNKEGGTPAEKRLKILIAQIREVMGQGGLKPKAAPDGHPVKAIWCDTSCQLGDTMTKTGTERALLIKAMSEGRWTPLPSAEAIETKAAIRAGRHARAEAKRSAKAAIRGSTSEQSESFQ
jgi:hypothetical protein